MSKRAIRVAMNFRVSTISQKVDGTSLDTQERRTREYAAKLGYEVVEALVISESHSGTDLNCPGIIRLKQAASAGQFDVLLFHSFDRLYRPENVGDEWKALELMAFFTENGVTVEFVDGSVPSDPRYAAVASIFAGMNSGDYRRKMIEATQRGRDERKAQGRFLGTPLLGYSKDAEMRLVPDEDQAAIVRTIFNLYDHERLGLREVQKRLIGRIPAPKGGTVWHQSYLHRILTNPAYWSGEHLSGVPCPPIIDEEQAKRVQTRLRRNHRLKSGRKTVWPLQGRVRCQCGSHWKCQSYRPGKAKAQYFCRARYSDATRQLGGAERCEVPRRDKHELEQAVFNTIADAVHDPDSLAIALEASLRGMQERIEFHGIEIAPLRAALDETDRQLAEIDRARIRGRLSKAELDRNESELLGRRGEIEQQLSDFDPDRISELEEARAMLPAVEGLLGWAETYKGWPIKNMGGFTYFKPAGGPPGSPDLAKLWALFPPDWWIGKHDKFDDDEWAQTALTELLDRLHATIVMHDDHAELRGVLPLHVPIASDDVSTSSLHASHVPRELEGGLNRSPRIFDRVAVTACIRLELSPPP